MALIRAAAGSLLLHLPLAGLSGCSMLEAHQPLGYTGPAESSVPCSGILSRLYGERLTGVSLLGFTNSVNVCQSTFQLPLLSQISCRSNRPCRSPSGLFGYTVATRVFAIDFHGPGRHLYEA